MHYLNALSDVDVARYPATHESLVMCTTGRECRSDIESGLPVLFLCADVREVCPEAGPAVG
jgi:hypothetical protein